MDLLAEYRRNLLASYSAVPGKLAGCLPLVQKASLKDDTGWSFQKAVYHLSVEEKEVYTPALRLILSDAVDKLPLRGELDIVRIEGHEHDLETVIGELGALYQEKLALLSGLHPDAWSKTARHKTLGVRTLQWWVERSLYHAVWHLDQFTLPECEA